MYAEDIIKIDKTNVKLITKVSTNLTFDIQYYTWAPPK